MGIDSEYYKEKNKKKLIKLRQLESVMPPYVVSYLNDKELSSQINTVIAYAYDLQTFFRFLTEKNNLLKNTAIKNISIDFLECLTFEDINEYQRYLRFNSSVDGSSHQNQDKAIARRMAALRGLFEFLCLHQYMKNNPTVGAAKRIKMPQKDIIRLNDEEVNTFLNVVSNTNIKGNKLQIEKCKKTQLRDTALITLLLNTGIRVSECAGLDIDDINFNYRTINIVRKGGSDAHLYFNEATKKALKDYIENERPLLLGNTESDEQAVFISMKKSRMSISAIERMVKKYAKNATPDKKISPHKMRSTYGTALYKDTGDIRLVSDVLGHKDINTTAKHYAAMEEEHRKLAAMIPLYQEKKEERIIVCVIADKHNADKSSFISVMFRPLRMTVHSLMVQEK